MDRLDGLTYLGEVIGIYNNGSVSAGNIYPAGSIFCAVLLITVHENPYHIIKIVPIFFSLLFISGIYLYSRFFLDKLKRYFAFEYILMPILVIYYLRSYHFSISPHYFYFSLLPMALYLLLGLFLADDRTYRTRHSWIIAISIIVVEIPLMHPFIYIQTLYILILGILYFYYLRANKNQLFIYLSLIATVGFIFWLFHNFKLYEQLEKISNSISGQARMSTLAQGTNALSSGIFKVEPIDLIQFILISYGRYIVPVMIISLTYIFVISKCNHNSLVSQYKTLFCIFIAYCFFDFALVLNPFIPHVFERLTTLNVFIYGLIPLFTLSLGVMIRKLGTKSVVSIVMILGIIFGLSIFGLSNSPLTFRSNTASTYNEAEGLHWLFSHKNNAVIIDTTNPQNVYRYCDFMGGGFGAKREMISYSPLPKHFGYDQMASLNKTNAYITSFEYSKMSYSKSSIKVNDMKDYDLKDYERLDMDCKVSKIFNSLDIDVYRT
ncbi:hypothetical protein E2N92_10545 [Methanofollis formosanus]|uniref:Uncharacterized protein n=1 Tax=Methanofollis formosanus TaxID=299308 RepID=A0A8G1A3M2_9EURY|nr:hypothetical protein [Methanofollis formosanus]QYZ79833.1 hypothetical protein E2N92_10545 [Methanofollis formosanus]